MEIIPNDYEKDLQDLEKFVSKPLKNKPDKTLQYAKHRAIVEKQAHDKRIEAIENRMTNLENIVRAFLKKDKQIRDNTTIPKIKRITDGNHSK